MKVRKGLLLFLVALAGCFQAVDPKYCHWRIIEYTAQGVVNPDGTISVTSVFIPTDSEQICIVDDAQ